MGSQPVGAAARQDLKAQLAKTQELLQLAVKEKESTQKIIEVLGSAATVQGGLLFFSLLRADVG